MKTNSIILLVFSIILSSNSFSQFKNFISSKGDKLMDGNEELRFVSFNIPNLHYIEDNMQFTNPNPWRLPTEFEIRDALTSIKIMGGNVTRMYVLSVRKQGEEKEILRHVEAPGQFNEESFRAIDKVLQVANEVGVRVIIPIVDNWWWWGGPREYAEFRGKQKEEFWTDTVLFSDYRKTAEYYLNRVNSYTGIRYKDDKAILGWETGNELQPPSYDFTKKAAAAIKSIDTNHLVIEGTNGRLISDEVLNDKNVDVLSTHNYGRPNETIPQIMKARERSKGMKPLFIGEFGFIPTEEMRTVIDTVINNGISGIMVWSLRGHNQDGGFYYHTNAYRVPGFESGKTWDEIAVMNLFREKAFQINNKKIEPFPVPQSPKLLPIETPFKISWLGSTGASSYSIERREEGSGIWKIISDNASDAEIGYRPLYSDNSVEVGKQYYYRISAKNESGISEPSEPFGPVKVEYLMFIDEFENDLNFYGRMGELRYLHSVDVSKAKEDKHRLAGSSGDYIVYKLPHKLISFALDVIYTKKEKNEILILTGENINSMKLLKMKTEVFENYKNEYGALLPVRYSIENIPETDRFIKIILTNSSQFCRMEVKQKQGSFKLASIIADSMVLQQRTNVPIWGKGIVGATISLKPSWRKESKTKVGTDGSWLLKLPTPKAGGPYELTIKEYDTTIVLKNILIGEVWLASGQSNMEMPLEGWPPTDTIMHSASEILIATHSNIRMFTVQHAISLTPEFSTVGKWIPSTPEAAAKFSATAYFFAKALYTPLKVPIGIIHSSWGGTPIEPWISAEAISTIEEQKTILKKIDESKAEIKKYRDWQNTFSTVDISKKFGDNKWSGLNFSDEECSLPNYNDAQWKEMKLPQNWERTEMGYFDGVIWYRKKIEVPQSWINKKITVELGPVDDMDITFVNGKRIGGMEGEGMWKVDRVYAMPDSFIKNTTVSIAVRVVDIQGGGGIFGEEKQMVIRLAGTNETVSIAGNWKYLPVACYEGGAFYVFGAKGEQYFSRPKVSIEINNYTPTTIYNAMIAPIIPYAIKGAIWYQGESNTGNPESYKSLFPTMIGDWRKRFSVGDFPFYYVQIAPYEYGANTHSELLRESQFTSLSTKNTGMVVTLDIGNPKNIHPSNKKDVGDRLAHWALAKDYGKKISFSGPVYSSMKKEKEKIILSFNYVGTGLVLKGSGTEFQIAGEDKIFKEAVAVIRGKNLVVSHPEIKNPAVVRYAFTNTSSATLFNTDGLPASSFRTDNWK